MKNRKKKKKKEEESMSCTVSKVPDFRVFFQSGLEQ